MCGNSLGPKLEKISVMVKDGILLIHKVSANGFEVDKANVAISSSRSPPILVKGKRIFLGHTRFNRRFIKISLAFQNFWQPFSKKKPSCDCC